MITENNTNSTIDDLETNEANADAVEEEIATRVEGAGMTAEEVLALVSDEEKMSIKELFSMKIFWILVIRYQILLYINTNLS